jgi:hypothetical protein
MPEAGSGTVAAAPPGPAAAHGVSAGAAGAAVDAIRPNDPNSRSLEQWRAQPRAGLMLLPLRAVLPLLAGLASLTGCTGVLDPETRLTLEVAEARVPCVGAAPQECLLVRFAPGQQYTMFYDAIAGFDYEPGYRYRLRVSRRTIRNPPANGSSYAYTLLGVDARESSPRRALLLELDQAEAQWNAARPVAWTMVVERICFCAPDARGPVRIDVDRRESGTVGHYERVVRRRYENDGRDVPAQFWSLFPSVHGLFGIVRFAVAADAHAIDVEFDEDAGFPRRIYIDPAAGLADDEVEYVVHSLAAPS